ncbi:PfkB family carbohydrate kinase [Pseudotabrizicola alkalilacus]|uniref:Ribokinase n=1 Tax=Pseudotabrizicola alkalilacus TaxID=2305252 RepID=A0A411YX13_9RHOB|nr:PfkB family carbohydrate kinase [Pseudotabrizicola alkalilacus]RGP35273.1 ribokinase [Pseudotabrizicola alkalilacus]
MPQPVKILAFGDNVVDCYRDQNVMFPGGNCVNLAVFARRAGAETAYIGAVCDDAAGRLIRDALRSEGVDVSGLRVGQGQTAYCVIETLDGERAFVGAHLGVSIIAPSATDLAVLPGHDAIHTGRSSHVDDWLSHFALTTRVSYDMATETAADRIAQIAPCCYLLSFSGSGLSRDQAVALAERGRNSGADWCLVTRGSDGALLLGDAGLFETASHPVAAVDTLGAGDTFIATVLTGLLEQTGPATVLANAAQAASETCMMRGAFGYAAPMAVDLSSMMTIDEIYKTTKPATALI